MKAPERINRIGPFLQLFFTEHMMVHKRASAQTIASYRDTFRLLLQFVQDRTGIPPAALPLTAIDADCVLDFLNHVERDRGCSARSRNNRLAAIRTFFRFVSLRDPTSLGTITRIMAIPTKRCEKKLVGFLSRDEVKALIAAPNSRTWSGRRDHALLLTLYNTGARISEVIGLRRRQVNLDSGAANIQLFGKGRKERVVPLWEETGRVLRAWFREFDDTPAAIVFPSARNEPLSRDGADYILRRAVVAATASCPALANKSVSPHLLRHSTAMHLLQSGVDLAVIALWLGHENIQTTNVYITADLASKERALQKLEPMPGSFSRYQATDKLLAFLTTL
jgi:site-specific recombinase XerD